MSNAGAYATSLMAQHGIAAERLAWNAAEAQAFQRAATLDAHAYWYSGLVSLGEACQGVQKSRYTWATVKAYYATFYLSRAFLGFAGVCVEYLHSGSKTRHYVWRSTAGSGPTRLSGNTHDAVLRYVDANGSIPRLTGQTIASDAVGEWLIAQRNRANYGEARFSDPSPTPCMSYISTIDKRRLLQAYIEDNALLFTFDPAHAILAYPVTVARLLSTTERSEFSDDDVRHLNGLYRDSVGPLAFSHSLFVPV